MQLHYEYFKSDSIRVTLMSKCKIMFILHFVSLHSKVSELEILDSCCSFFFWNLECISSQYSKLLQLNFTICFPSKVNLLKIVIKTMAPIFLLWVNFSIRFYWYEWLYSVTVVYFTFNEFLNFEAEIIWSFPEIQHLKLWFWRPLKICHRFNVYNSELVDNSCILIRLHMIGLLE